MSSRTKINIAFFVCIVFIFRAVFLNFGSLTAVIKAHSNNQPVTHTFQKAGAHSDASVREHTAGTSLAEVFEEITDKQEDYLAKIGSLAVLCIFYSFLTLLTFFPKPGRLFDFIKCVLYPKRYLSLSILRI